MDFVENLLWLLEIYFGVGFLFVLIFFWKGQARLGHPVTGASWGFRLIIIPSLVGLWPTLIWPLIHSTHAQPWPGGSSDRPISPGFLRRIQVLLWIVLLVVLPIIMTVAVRSRSAEYSPSDEVSELANLVRQGGH